MRPSKPSSVAIERLETRRLLSHGMPGGHGHPHSHVPPAPHLVHAKGHDKPDDAAPETRDSKKPKPVKVDPTPSDPETSKPSEGHTDAEVPSIDDDGAVHIVGTPGNDVITLSIDGMDSSKLDVIVNGTKTQFTLSQVRSIQADGGAGNDAIEVSELNGMIDLPVTFTGGPGDDTLVGGSGNDHLDGGPGNDLLAGQGGDDNLIGGPGNDFLLGGTGTNTIDPGPGANIIPPNGGTENGPSTNTII